MQMGRGCLQYMRHWQKRLFQLLINLMCQIWCCLRSCLKCQIWSWPHWHKCVPRCKDVQLHKWKNMFKAWVSPESCWHFSISTFGCTESNQVSYRKWSVFVTELASHFVRADSLIVCQCLICLRLRLSHFTGGRFQPLPSVHTLSLKVPYRTM